MFNLKKLRFLPETSQKKNGVDVWMTSYAYFDRRGSKPLGEINKVNGVVY